MIMLRKVKMAIAGSIFKLGDPYFFRNSFLYLLQLVTIITKTSHITQESLPYSKVEVKVEDEV